MTDDQMIQTLRELENNLSRTVVAFSSSGNDTTEKKREQADAVRAALALASRRCGNCGHWQMSKETTLGFCQMLLRPMEVSDGCILGWVAKS